MNDCDTCGTSTHTGHDTEPRDITRKAARRLAPPADRPYQCKECGHPCRSQGDLESHRRGYHDAKGIPKVTRVIGAMTFPCPDCGRVYDDENRLTHHRRVIHDFEARPPMHVVEAHTPMHAERVG